MILVFFSRKRESMKLKIMGSKMFLQISKRRKGRYFVTHCLSFLFRSGKAFSFSHSNGKGPYIRRELKVEITLRGS